MKPIDRMYSALYHEEPDKVPDGWDDACSVYWFSAQRNEIIMEMQGLRIIRSHFGSVHLEVRGKEWEGREKWDWWFNIVPAVRWPEDLKRLEQPKIDLEQVKEVKRKVEELHREGYFVFIVHDSPFFSPVVYLRGLKQWLIDIVRTPSFARDLIKFAVEPQMEIAKAILEEAKVDCVWMFGDQGTPKGPFLSPKQYRDLIYPWDRRLCESYHKKGAFVFIHSHGYLMPIMDDLVKAGFDAIHPVSPLCRMRLAEMKEKYGDKITLFAELSADAASQVDVDTHRYGSIQFGFGHIEEKIKALEYTIKTAARGGGFIFATTVQPTTKQEMSAQEQIYWKSWERLRRYPIIM